MYILLLFYLIHVLWIPILVGSVPLKFSTDSVAGRKLGRRNNNISNNGDSCTFLASLTEKLVVAFAFPFRPSLTSFVSCTAISLISPPVDNKYQHVTITSSSSSPNDGNHISHGPRGKSIIDLLYVCDEVY